MVGVSLRVQKQDFRGAELKPRAIPFLQKNRKRPRSRTDCLCIIFRAPSFRLFPGERVGNLEPEDTKSCGQGPN